ncbi:DNA-directed RNA polymerase II subunit rpb2 [Tetrabaena socialis]|uniref:DNA-directed RNA polymerase n=1 Tax=Tetrabaena socialis TaxID=47790 RepID=A0A2J7ZS61_9CHLO|nr:DNA-directed RNA polymerase II subunit rpb2 [Tetrabaena socialis]|eukprot:PNH03106.1 DNA-directed RNA polymerase II subunit rpb2 [Tetrabaena socialis]
MPSLKAGDLDDSITGRQLASEAPPHAPLHHSDNNDRFVALHHPSHAIATDPHPGEYHPPGPQQRTQRWSSASLDENFETRSSGSFASWVRPSGHGLLPPSPPRRGSAGSHATHNSGQNSGGGSRSGGGASLAGMLETVASGDDEAEPGRPAAGLPAAGPLGGYYDSEGGGGGSQGTGTSPPVAAAEGSGGQPARSRLYRVAGAGEEQQQQHAVSAAAAAYAEHGTAAAAAYGGEYGAEAGAEEGEGYGYGYGDGDAGAGAEAQARAAAEAEQPGDAEALLTVMSGQRAQYRSWVAQCSVAALAALEPMYGGADAPYGNGDVLPYGDGGAAAVPPYGDRVPDLVDALDAAGQARHHLLLLKAAAEAVRDAARAGAAFEALSLPEHEEYDDPADVADGEAAEAEYVSAAYGVTTAVAAAAAQVKYAASQAAATAAAFPGEPTPTPQQQQQPSGGGGGGGGPRLEAPLRQRLVVVGAALTSRLRREAADLMARLDWPPPLAEATSGGAAAAAASYPGADAPPAFGGFEARPVLARRLVGVLTALVHYQMAVGQRAAFFRLLSPPRRRRHSADSAAQSDVSEYDVVMNMLEHELFPHIGTDLYIKAVYLGFMVRKLLRCSLGEWSLDDRDSYVNKRIDTPGILIANLFRQYYAKAVKDMRNLILKDVVNWPWRATNKLINVITKNNVYKLIKPTIIESGLKYGLATGNWGVKSSRQRQGVAQVLNRMTYLSTLSHLRRINTPIEKTGKLVQPRKLHPTQWGVICPSETPEGASVGLVKNLAMTTTITIASNALHVRQLLLDLGARRFEAGCDISSFMSKTFIFINGSIMGVHDDPPTLYHALKRAKRSGRTGLPAAHGAGPAEAEGGGGGGGRPQTPASSAAALANGPHGKLGASGGGGGGFWGGMLGGGGMPGSPARRALRDGVVAGGGGGAGDGSVVFAAAASAAAGAGGSVVAAPLAPVFGEYARALSRLHRDGCLSLAREVALGFGRCSVAYRHAIEANPTFPFAPEDDSEPEAGGGAGGEDAGGGGGAGAAASITPSFAPALRFLQATLARLSRRCDKATFADVWRGAALSINRFMFNFIATESRFTRAGARQFAADVAGLAQLFAPYGRRAAGAAAAAAAGGGGGGGGGGQQHFRELQAAARLLLLADEEAADVMRRASAAAVAAASGEVLSPHRPPGPRPTRGAATGPPGASASFGVGAGRADPLRRGLWADPVLSAGGLACLSPLQIMNVVEHRC